MHDLQREAPGENKYSGFLSEREPEVSESYLNVYVKTKKFLTIMNLLYGQLNKETLSADCVNSHPSG